MPELPEVETTRLGVLPHAQGRVIREVVVRRRDLRWPVSENVDQVAGETIVGISRRSKYLLFHLSGSLDFLIHLGMSGSLRVTSQADEWRKHDHLAFQLSDGNELRYHDPRRFGACLTFPRGSADQHALLKNLGPEPLGDDFNGPVLHAALRGKTISLKAAIMDAKIVVGVGNIYASESLFRSGIRPTLMASRLSKPRAEELARNIKAVLSESIQQGGTTLRDFVNSSGEPGYFKQSLFVYGRAGEPCRECGTLIKSKTIAQRNTFWCPRCQKS